MSLKYNVMKIMCDTGNPSWGYAFDTLKELVEYCSDAKNTRKVCDLHFYAFETEQQEDNRQVKYLGTIKWYHPKRGKIECETPENFMPHFYIWRGGDPKFEKPDYRDYLWYENRSFK